MIHFYFVSSSSPDSAGGDCSNTVSCDDTDLNKTSTFFLEYVVEDSNAATYFNKHVAGLTFTSGEDDSGNGGNMDTIVWYSNTVSRLPC